jgi:hypothetical protein
MPRAVKGVDALFSSNKLKKFKQMSARKLMAPVSYGRREVLMVEFMQRGTMLTSEVYCETGGGGTG